MSAAGFWTDAGESLLELANKIMPCGGGREKVDLDFPEYKEIVESGRLMERVVEIAGAIWYFLACGSPFLELIENPIILDKNGEDSVFGYSLVRDGIFELGCLCFIYGRHLSEICYGNDFSM